LNYAAVALSQTSKNGATYGIVPPGANTDTNSWMQIGDSWVKIEVLGSRACINLNSIDAATLQRLPIFQNSQSSTELLAAIMTGVLREIRLRPTCKIRLLQYALSSL